jgi:hypothetical protein
VGLSAPGLAAAHVPFCTETVNPHGANVPPAGFTTPPGTNPKSGQNPDGFYLVGTNTGFSVELFDGCPGTGDGGSGFDFGTFLNETNIKYTEANGTTPAVKSIGSIQGAAGAVEAHLLGNGDLLVCSADNTDPSACVCCHVSPPPR